MSIFGISHFPKKDPSILKNSKTCKRRLQIIEFKKTDPPSKINILIQIKNLSLLKTKSLTKKRTTKVSKTKS